jgi:hypothetical protein
MKKQAQSEEDIKAMQEAFGSIPARKFTDLTPQHIQEQYEISKEIAKNQLSGKAAKNENQDQTSKHR